MRRTTIVALCAATLAAVAPGISNASHEVVTGSPCAVYALQSDVVTGEAYDGVLEAGPVTAVVADVTPALVEIRCEILVNGLTIGSYGATGTTTAVLPAARTTFAAGRYDTVAVCTTALVTTAHGTTGYTYAAGVWSPGGAASCSLAENGYSGPVPPAPFYPMGIIDIVGNGTSWTYSLNNVFPPDGWTCTTGFMEVECDPPPAPPGSVNNCRIITVRATNHGLGTVTGNGRCVDGASANATSVGPTSTPTVAATAPGGSFPWRCKVTVAQPIAAPWEVTCTMSH